MRFGYIYIFFFFFAVGHRGEYFLDFFCLKANFDTVSDLKCAAACFICRHLGLKS